MIRWDTRCALIDRIWTQVDYAWVVILQEVTKTLSQLMKYQETKNHSHICNFLTGVLWGWMSWEGCRWISSLAVNFLWLETLVLKLLHGSGSVSIFPKARELSQLSPCPCLPFSIMPLGLNHEPFIWFLFTHGNWV